MILVCKRFRFDAAHRLPYYDGKCQNLHGHSWVFEVEVAGRILEDGPKRGMILDFVDLKAIVNKAVVEAFDHTCINDYIENPTAEILVGIFTDSIKDALHSIYKYRITLERLRLYESEDSFIEWRRE